MKNSAGADYASKKIASSKWLLLLCAASAAAVDIIIIVMLFMGGEGGEYLACPFILLVFDVIYFAVSLFFTNFRFKYSIGVWVSYIVLYTVGLVIGVAIIFGSNGTVLTNSAITLWSGVHAFNVVCAVIFALFASHVIKKLWVALIFAVIFLGGAGTYAGYLVTDGFFGQGTGVRTLVYSYDKGAEQYTVTGVLAGKSGTVTVPETFNGKPVTKINLSVFAERGVTKYNLPENVAFTGEGVLARELNLSGKTISVDKESVNEVRDTFLSFAVSSNDTACENAVALANATLPVNLAENEGYVAFNYDAQGFGLVNGNTIPVFVGDLQTFDVSGYTAGFDYITHRDNGTADNYFWAYENLEKYILSDVEAENGSLFDLVECSGAYNVKFERVYRFSVDNGNDTKYLLGEKQPEMCFESIGGTNYKYMTKGAAADYLNSLAPRKGFTYRWLYYRTTPAADGRYFTDLAEILDDDIILSPRWELKKPQVTVGTNAQNNTITYGDDVEISSQVEIEAEGVTPEYSWTYGNETQSRWSTDKVNLTRPKPSEMAGAYNLVVTLNGGEVTSLTEFATASVDLTINRRQIDLQWNFPDNAVYDGSLKTVSVSHDQSLNVTGDPLTYTFTGLKSFKDADTYNFSVTVDSITRMNYDVRNISASFTVQPRPVQVEWSGYENLKYTGLTQCPAASATGVDGDGALAVTVTGAGKNAGDYTARASITDANYTLINPARQYNIAKIPLTVTPDPVTFTYGSPVNTAPNTENAGFVNGETALSLGGRLTVTYGGTNAGFYSAQDNGVTVSGYNFNNYEITYLPAALTITPREAVLSWSGATGLTYNAREKNVAAIVSNRVSGDDVTVLVSGGNEINAGPHTATAYALSGTAKDNYSLTETVYPYTIAAARLTIKPADKTSQYGEALVPLTATVGTIYGSDNIGYELVKEEGDGAGTYAITVNVTRANPNYEIVAGSGTYTITRRVAYALWLTESQRTFTYDGNEKSVFGDNVIYSYRGFLEKDIPYVLVTGHKATNAGDYTATVTLDSSIAGNYDLAQPECKWKINKAGAHYLTLRNGVKEPYNDFEAETGDVISWVSDTNEFKVSYTFSGDDSAVVHNLDGSTFTVPEAGVYKFTVNFTESANYGGASVTVTVTVSKPDEIETKPEVVE
ncbi:MAG: hypothetical protein NC131_07530 [Roseburia sp.]|nr:hypothetical protein [Roseburia sp.]